MGISSLVSIGQGRQGAELASGIKGPLDMSIDFVSDTDYPDPRRRAIALVFHAKHYAGRVRDAAADFHAEYGKVWPEITGDYVSDLVAELSAHVSILSSLVAELDKCRAELDAASFPVAGA